MDQPSINGSSVSGRSVLQSQKSGDQKGDEIFTDGSGPYGDDEISIHEV